MLKKFDYRTTINPPYPTRTQEPGPIRPTFIPRKEAPKEINPENVRKIFDTVLTGNLDQIKLLISTTNNPLNVRNDNKQTLIHYILENDIVEENDKLKIIKYLIEHGAGLTPDKYNVTPLHIAAKKQYKSIVSFLLSFSDVNATDSNGMNALHYLVQGNLQQCTDDRKNNEDIDLLFDNFLDELDEEQYSDKRSIYDSNYKITKSDSTYKCYYVNYDIVDLLYNANINMNKRDVTGSTPLLYAMELNDKILINRLLKLNAFINVKNDYGISPYTHFTNLYKMLLSQFCSLPTNNKLSNMITKYCTSPYENIQTKMNTKYKKNIAKNLDILFPQLLIMYNNLLYFYASKDRNNWSFSNNKNLQYLLFKKYNPTFGLSIASNIDLSIIPNVIKSAKRRQIDQKKQQNIENILKNLRDELDYYEDNNNELEISTPRRKNIVQQFKDKIKQAEKELAIVTNNIDTPMKYNDFANVNNINSILDRVDIDAPVAEQYDFLFNNLCKNNGNNNNVVPIVSITAPTTFAATAPPTSAATATPINTTNTTTTGATATTPFTFTTATPINTTSTASTGATAARVENKNNRYGDQSGGNNDNCDDYLVYNELWKQFINNDQSLDDVTNIHIKMVSCENDLITQLINLKKTNVERDFTLLNEFYETVLIKTIQAYYELPYDTNENYILNDVTHIIEHITKHILCSNLYYILINTQTEQNYQQHKQYIVNAMPKLLVENLIDINTDHTIDDIFEPIHVDDKHKIIVEYYKELCQLVIPQMKEFIDEYNMFILNEHKYVKSIIALLDQIKIYKQ